MKLKPGGLLLALAILTSATWAIEPAHVVGTFMVAPTSTLQGVAGTNTAITATVSGVEQQGTIQTPKQLYQGVLTTSAAALYTAGASVTAFITDIALINTTGSAVSGVKVFIGGSAAANQVLQSLTIPANGQAKYNATGWTITDANGAVQTASTGGTTYSPGTGLNLSPATTFNLNVPVLATSGGTGQITNTAHGVLLGEGSSAITATTPGTSGQLFIGQGASVDPLFATLSQDCTITLAGAVTCLKTNNVSFGTAATQNTGTSGATIPLLSAANTWALAQTFSTPAVGSITGNAATVTTNANLTGPVTSSGNATTITPTISAGGPIGSSSVVPVITYNAAGQLTAVTTAAITTSSVGAVPTTRTITSGAGLTGGGDLSADRTLVVGQNADNSIIVNADDIQRAALGGDITCALGSVSCTVTKVNGTSLAALATGILKNTTGTGVPSIAASGTDYAPATSGSTMLKGNGAGGFSSTAMTDSGTDVLTTEPLTFGTAVGAANSISIGESANCVTYEGAAADAFEMRDCSPTVTVGDQIWNRPDAAAVVTRTYASLEAAQTFTAVNTFSSPPVMSGASISAGTVANGSLANMNANTVKANITGGAAAPTDVTLASFKTWLAIVAADISDFAANVRSTVLTGLSTTTGATITVSDTVLGAFGKLQWQITASKGMYNAVYDFNMVGDQRIVFDGACSTGANTKITSATMAFVAGDNGKRITLNGGGASGVVLAGTISAIDSGTQVTISGATCGTTVSSKGLQLGTDNTTACNLIVSTINAQTYPNSKVIFPPSSTGRWACPVALPFTVGVDLIGQASAGTQDFADYIKSGGTHLVWWGTDNDAGVAFQGFVSWVAVAANSRPLTGAGLHDIAIDCRNGDQNPCGAAVLLDDVVGFDFRNVWIDDALAGIVTTTTNMASVTAATSRGVFSNIGMRIVDNATTTGTSTVTTTPTTIAVASNNQVLSATPATVNVAATTGMAAPTYFWTVADTGSVYMVRCASIASGTTLGNCAVSVAAATEAPTLKTGANFVQATPANGACMVTQGTATTNSNLFTFQQGRLQQGSAWGPACIEMHNTDSTVFQQAVINGGSATNGGAINRVQKAGVRFGAFTSAGQASRNNVFYDGDAGAGGAVAMALTSTGTLLGGASGPNFWTGYQTGNGAPIPVIEAVAATVTQAPVGGIFEWKFPNGVHGQSSPTRASVLTPSNALASTAATDNVIPGCLVKNPPQWAQAGLNLQFRIVMNKAAGTPTHIYKIFYGTTGAVGTDTATLVSATGAAGTAVADSQEITLTILLGSTGAAVTPAGSVMRTGKLALAAAGYGNLTATAPTMAAINTGTAQTFFYPAIRTSAAGETNTIVSCTPEIIQAAAQ